MDLTKQISNASRLMKKNKKLFFKTLNNIFQQQIKETHQPTEKELPFLSKKKDNQKNILKHKNNV